MFSLSLTMTVVGFDTVVGAMMVVGSLRGGEHSHILLEPEEEIRRANRIKDNAMYDLNLVESLLMQPGSAFNKCISVANGCKTEALRTLINGKYDEATALRKLRGAGKGLRQIIERCERTIEDNQEVIRRRNNLSQ
jgi:hypothetical protein